MKQNSFRVTLWGRGTASLAAQSLGVYETSRGEVQVSRMNLGRMSMMFGGTVRQALKGGGANLEKALEGVVEG